MFFDFPEIVIIFGVALVVLGPKKLPGTAAQIGRWVGRARAMARQFREQLEQEVNSVESALDTKTSQEPSIRSPASSPAGTAPAPTPSSETPSAATHSQAPASQPPAGPPRAPSAPYPPYPATPAPAEGLEDRPPQQESLPFTAPYSGSHAAYGSHEAYGSHGAYGSHEAYGLHEAYGAPSGTGVEGVEDFEAGLAATGVPSSPVGTPPAERASPGRSGDHAESEAPSATGDAVAEHRDRR
jgi:sec-independent protein translocase protein TatB